MSNFFSSRTFSSSFSNLCSCSLLLPLALQVVQSWFQLYQELKNFISHNLRKSLHTCGNHPALSSKIQMGRFLKQTIPLYEIEYWHMTYPEYLFKMRNAKTPRFYPFSLSAPRNNVRGQRSDNFEATGRAHSSFGRFLPIFFGEHIEIGITSKTVGPRPPWSEMIQICVLKKTLF